MTTLRLNYPTLVWHTIDVKLTDEQADDVLNMHIYDRAKFIEAESKKEDIQYEPFGLVDALDVDYATIKRLP